MTYGQSSYGGEAYGDTRGVVASEVIEPPLLSNSFQIFAPAIYGDATLAVPLISNAFQVFAPASVAARGRPLAEDIRIMSINSSDATNGFHRALGSSLYPGALERERRVIFGDNATCTLYTVTPGAGDEVVVELNTGWMARRIPTIESSGPETWRLEIVDDRVDWNMLKYITKVRIRGATDEEQIYEVLQRYNAMKPGKVYQIQMQATCNIDPS